MAHATSSWFSVSNSNRQAALRLFCFPYAGGAASIFRSWATTLAPMVEVCPAQLPGHGTRLTELPLTRMELLIQSAAGELLPYLDKPFAFFGHSMGAVLSFELARHLRNEHGLAPLHLFVSAHRAPQIPDPAAPTFNLPEEEFLEELRRLQGTPAEVLENPELMQLVMPLLRADFEVIQNYTYSTQPPLDCPITTFGGLQDTEVKREDLEAWREHTTASFALRMLPGDHFFIHTAQPLLLAMLSQELARCVKDRAHQRPV